MLKLRLTNSFKKDYKLMQKRGYNINLLKNVVNELLQENKLDEKYHDHALFGKKFTGLRECHIQPDWLLVYQIIDTELILQLCYTGTHSDLF